MNSCKNEYGNFSNYYTRCNNYNNTPSYYDLNRYTSSYSYKNSTSQEDISNLILTLIILLLYMLYDTNYNSSSFINDNSLLRNEFNLSRNLLSNINSNLFKLDNMLTNLKTTSVENIFNNYWWIFILIILVANIIANDFTKNY